MIILRTLGNLLLAIILVVIIALVLSTGCAVVLSQTWENAGIADGVESGDWVWVDEQPIYYRTWGSDEDPCLVLLHGFYVEGSQTWETNAQALADAKLRVIAVDLKGFGHSTRDTSIPYTLREQSILLAKVLNQLRAQEAIVVAHGWGCQVALQLAYEQPQFVSKLVLIAPLVDREMKLPWQPVAKVPYVGRAVAWGFASGGPLRTFIMQRRFYDRSALDGEALQEASQPTHIVGTLDAFLAMATSAKDDDLPEALSGIDFPVLVLLGEHDPWVTPDEGLSLRRNIPGAKEVIVPEVGHYPHLERSAEVNRHIQEFCQSDAG